MKKINFAIYSRKSKYTGKGESTENQIEMCKAYLFAKFPEDYGADSIYIYEDEGFSGANIKRPEFMRMMTDARERKFGTIICYRLDRVSRNISDFAKLIDVLGELDISFISIKEQFDTSQPLGRAMMYIASIFSQLERETIGERIKDNLEELAKDGRWLGGITPTGYCSVKVNDGKKRKQRLEIMHDEAKVVKYIFESFAKTRSVTECMRLLERKKILSKNNKPFTPITIKGILENPVYMKADRAAYKFLRERGACLYADESSFDGKYGVMAYKKTLQRSGKTHQKLTLDKWIIAVGQHEGIVSGKLWSNAFEILKAPVIRNSYALLSGTIRCAACTAIMNTKKRAKDNGFSYVCKRACGVRCLNGAYADDVIRKGLRAFASLEKLRLDEERALLGKYFEAVEWNGDEVSISMRQATKCDNK